MRYAKLGMLLGLVVSSCGDDSTGNDTVAMTSGPGSTTAGPSSGDDVTTNGSASSGGTSGATSSSGSMDDSATTGNSGPMDTTDGTSVGETGLGDTFPCGEKVLCLVATEYCQQTVGGAIGNPPSYACMDLPDDCVGGGTCDCLQSVPCAMICEMVEGGVQVTCQAP